MTTAVEVPSPEPASAPDPATSHERAAAPAHRFDVQPELFPRSARALQADRFWLTGTMVTLAGLLIAGWLSWFILGRLPIRIVSASARVEVAQTTRPIASRVTGRVTAVHLTLNGVVNEGDVVVELDSSTERLALEEARTRLDALAAQVGRLDRERDARQQAVDLTAATAKASLDQAEVLRRAAEEAARVAAAEADRKNQLYSRGLLPELDHLRADAEARALEQVAKGKSLDLDRLTAEHQSTAAGRRAELAELEREMERVRGERAATSSVIGRLERAVDDRLVRAASTGRVGDVTDVHVGDVVQPGTTFGIIVPDGAVRLVAWFTPADAVGRVRVGQPARVRLDARPWTQYGMVSCLVSAVGSAERNGMIRTELIVSEPNPRIALEHGQTATVEVEVERLSPMRLALRAVAGVLAPRSLPVITASGAR